MAKMNTPPLLFCVQVIRTISKRLIDNKPSIDTLIIQCATLHSLDEFKELSDVIKVPTMHGRELRSGEFSQVGAVGRTKF